MFLGWLGTCPIEAPFIYMSRFAAAVYFIYLLVVLPFFATIETLL